MTDREMEAFVAVQVMGWPEWEFGNASPPSRPYFRRWMLRRGKVPQLVVCREDGSTNPWEPLLDANADFEVLQRVRESWDTTQQEQFDEAVVTIRERRAEERRENPDWWYAYEGLLAEPGDYTRAAAAVMSSWQ